MKNRWLTNTILSLTLLTLIAGAYGPHATTHTQAGGLGQNVNVVRDSSATGKTSAAKNTLTAAATGLSAKSDAALAYKEFTLDPIAYALARRIIQKMVASIVTWINSGFQGSPAFVTDLEGFLLDVADEVAGDFIYGSELGFLCSPFELDVRIALETTYQKQRSGYEPQCTLTDVTNNVENFLQGSFSDGGWASWFELTQGETNDPNAAYLDAEIEMYAAIRNAQEEEITLLDWGDGFLSYKVCSDTQVQSGAQTDCDIVTPGRVIADQLNESLGVGRDMLITADEVNEIIGALLAQLAQQALTGINGLLGLGGSSQFSDNSFGPDEDSSYLDGLVDEDPFTTGTSTGTSTSPTGIQNVALANAITAEEERLDLASEIVVRIEAAQAEYNERVAALQDNEARTCTPPDYPEELDTWLADYQNTVADSNLSILALTEIQSRFASSTDPIEQNEIAMDFLELQQSGDLTTSVSNTQLELFIEFELMDTLEELHRDFSEVEDNCRQVNR